MFFFFLYTYSVRSATVGEEKRSDRRRNRLDIRRMAVASVGEGGHLAGTVYQKQMRGRVDHSATRHHRRSLSTRVNIHVYIIFIICTRFIHSGHITIKLIWERHMYVFDFNMHQTDYSYLIRSNESNYYLLWIEIHGYERLCAKMLFLAVVSDYNLGPIALMTRNFVYLRIPKCKLFRSGFWQVFEREDRHYFPYFTI